MFKKQVLNLQEKSQKHLSITHNEEILDIDSFFKANNKEDAFHD